MSEAMRMKPSQLIAFLRLALPAKVRVLVKGPPGIGKTEIGWQVARMLGAHLITSFPALEDPTDPKGLPVPDTETGVAHFYPFGNLAKAMAATELTIWNIEDLGHANPSMQASYMQLVRGSGPHPVSEHVVFYATTNDRKHKAGVQGILEPVKSSFHCIIELVVDIDDWCAWAYQQDYIPAWEIAFLRFKGDDTLNAFDPTLDIENSPVPRQWAAVGRILNLGAPKPIRNAAIAGAVGEGAMTELVAFEEMYNALPSIDDILTKPDHAPVPTRPSELCAVATGLAVRADKSNFHNVARYAERLAEAGHGEYATLVVRDATRREPKLLKTEAFTRLAASELGELIGGVEVAA